MNTAGVTDTNVIVILNAGSSSLKFSVYAATDSTTSPRLHGQCDYASSPLRIQYYVPVAETPGSLQERPVVRDAQLSMLHVVLENLWQLVEQLAWRVCAVGHRVVHGGARYGGPVFIDDQVQANLQELIPWAPLHQPDCLLAIRLVQERSPELPQVACFDTAFHQTMDWEAKTYAIPRELTNAGLRRYGFHGLSFQSVVRQLHKCAPELANSRLVIAHLGSGSSLCAVQNSQSRATTMGLTPLDGLPMATRCGNLDPGILLHLLKTEQKSLVEVEALLYRQSGLLGVSQLSGDLRKLQASEQPAARDAIQLLVYRIVQEIGTMTASLAGVDAIVFTGGIGENSVEIRQQVCHRLSWLGVELDDRANARHAMRLHKSDSQVAILRLCTDEALEIAIAVREMCNT